MNGADLWIVLILVAVVGLSVFLIIRRRKKGSSCCGPCGSCDCHCKDK